MAITREEMAAGLEHLAQAFGARLTQERINAYHDILGDQFTPDTWEVAVKQAGSDCERFPMPKRLVECISGAAVEVHQCDLCAGTSGFVQYKKLITRVSGEGKIKGMTKWFYQPCPARRDLRARRFYADAAQAEHMNVGEYRATVEATARGMSKGEASRIKSQIDPTGKAPF